MRRTRHRDGQLLRGGIGLTTGLGWSDRLVFILSSPCRWLFIRTGAPWLFISPQRCIISFNRDAVCFSWRRRTSERKSDRFWLILTAPSFSPMLDNFATQRQLLGLKLMSMHIPSMILSIMDFVAPCYMYCYPDSEDSI